MPPLASPCAAGDATVGTLAALFREHPVWQGAARYLDARAESAVAFTHLPGVPYRLVRRRGRTLLVAGRARDPDLSFRFTPAAVARLAAVRGDVGDFAVELFSRIVDRRRARGVEVRVLAPFARLVRRGYVRLLLAAGPKVLAFGAARGVWTIGGLRARIVAAATAPRSRRSRASGGRRGSC